MRRNLTQYDNLSRLAPASHLRAAVLSYNNLSSYSPSNLYEWIKNTGMYWLHKKHKYQTYSLSDTGIYPISNYSILSIAGDWASGTAEAEEVAKQMLATTPDYTIHLGDTYYVGKATEVMENFLGIRTTNYEPTKFPEGRSRTFALLGNHDMYTNGNGYFDVMLPAIGQKASFFALQNDYWIIIGLDTGYNSTGLDLWPFKPSCRLRDEQVSWLRTIDTGNKGIILLSHHQPWSSFETAYPTPAKQVASVIQNKNRERIYWFWGHEHRMAIYQDYAGIAGRCIGHGGMPVKLARPKNTKDIVCTFVDSRLYPDKEGLHVGYNGFAILRFVGSSVVVEYRDLQNTLVYSETLR